MESIALTNGTKVFIVTRATYNKYKDTIYAEYEPVQEPEPKVESKSIEDYTKAQIVSLLKEKGIEFNPQDNKASLIELYESRATN